MADAQTVVTGEVRLSYAHIATPRTNDKGNIRYETAILIPKSDKATVKAIEAAIEAAKVVGKDSKWGGKIPPSLKIPLRDGDTERDLDDNPEYAGHWFINTGSNKMPVLVDAQLDPIMDKSEIYSGVYACVRLRMFPFNTDNSKGVGAGLNGIQKTRDGDPFGGGESAETIVGGFNVYEI